VESCWRDTAAERAATDASGTPSDVLILRRCRSDRRRYDRRQHALEQRALILVILRGDIAESNLSIQKVEQRANSDRNRGCGDYRVLARAIASIVVRPFASPSAC
jgi:hypothetical protein